MMNLNDFKNLTDEEKVYQIETAKNEDKKSTKVSLRSKTIDLTPVVEKFNGGGHKMAAGCTIRKPAKEAIELILDELVKCVNC